MIPYYPSRRHTRNTGLRRIHGHRAGTRLHTGTRLNPVPVGSRIQVHNGTARRTRGGLGAGDLVVNKHGHLVSARASRAATRRWNSNPQLRSVFRANRAAPYY